LLLRKLRSASISRLVLSTFFYFLRVLMNLRFPPSFVLKLNKAMVERLAAAELQPQRKTQRRCGHEALPALRQTRKKFNRTTVIPPSPNQQFLPGIAKKE